MRDREIECVPVHHQALMDLQTRMQTQQCKNNKKDLNKAIDNSM